jgi:hypothetical protein
MIPCRETLAIAGISHREKGIRINEAVFGIIVPEGK